MDSMLTGVRVLSLAQQYPGPYCTMLLADLGAEVTIIEQPGRGDPARAFPSFFSAVNRGKRSITLDLKSEAGRSICWELLATVDVFLEGFRPGVMERLGLGHRVVREQFPALVYCSISGYGQFGPSRDNPGHDLSYLGVAGMLAGGGSTGLHPGLAIADLSSAMFSTVGILAALLKRQPSDEGQYIDVSMTDGLVSWMGTVLEPLLNGEADVTASTEPAYGVFECADGKAITLSIAHEDHFWKNLCQCLDLDDLVALGAAGRRLRAGELREVVAASLRSKPRDHWLASFAAADVPASALLSPEEVIEDSHFRARGMFVEAPGELGDLRWHVGNPLKFSPGKAIPPTRAPRLGEHSDAVLAALGRSREAIAKLRSDAVI